MLEVNQDKHTITFKATEIPLVFSFSHSSASLISSFVLFLLLPISCALLWFPLTAMLSFEFILCSPSPYLSLSSFFPCLLFQSGGDPFAYGKKKRLFRNLNNCAAQFSSLWTLGLNGGGMTLYQDKGTRMGLSQAFVSMFFTGGDQC